MQKYKRLLYSASFLFIATLLIASPIGVYFTSSIDTNYALQIKADGEVDCIGKLAELISTAKHTIDFCFYSLHSAVVSEALIKAHKRGVKVRVITDNASLDKKMTALLKKEGIIVIGDNFPENDRGASYQMHNKFMILDGREETSKEVPIVWTGSFNINDKYASKDANNVIVNNTSVFKSIFHKRHQQ